MCNVQENFLPSLHVPQGLEHSWVFLSHEPDTIHTSASPQCRSGSLSPVEKDPKWSDCPLTATPSEQTRVLISLLLHHHQAKCSGKVLISLHIHQCCHNAYDTQLGWRHSDVLQRTVLGNGPERPWNKGPGIWPAPLPIQHSLAWAALASRHRNAALH